MKTLRFVAALVLFLGALGIGLGSADALSIVPVGAPTINCIFDLTCTILVTDTTDTITLPFSVGTGFLQSRTFTGQPGSPAAGLFGYDYRIDLTGISGLTALPCIDTLRIDFGPVVSTLNFDGLGGPDQVYVVTSGGLGTVGPTAANQVGDTIEFRFDQPVCPQSTSYFFGLVSEKPPIDVVATVHEILTGTTLSLKARAPQRLAAAGNIIRLLTEQVNRLPLQGGIQNALGTKLRAAMMVLDAHHTGAACGLLGAFTNQVQAQAGKALTMKEAMGLMHMAMEAEIAIGCQ
jgi:hypothetical protein